MIQKKKNDLYPSISMSIVCNLTKLKEIVVGTFFSYHSFRMHAQGAARFECIDDDMS